MSKKLYNSFKDGDKVKVWITNDFSRLADDMCPNINCDGVLIKDNFYIVCDSCAFSIFEDHFNKIVAKELGTHGDSNDEPELEW